MHCALYSIGEYDAMQSLSAMSACIMYLLAWSAVVQPGGVSRCRVRPPTSQATYHIDMWRRISDIKMLATRGTDAGAGKQTTMLPFFCWQCLTGTRIATRKHGGA